MKIAVSGCGIAGTCVATLLARQGHQVTIFEQAETCRPVGAGIMLQPSGQEVLRRLGILDEVAKRSTRLLGLKARLASGRTLIQLRYESLNQETYALGVHRGVLFEQLLRLCNDCGVEVVNSTHLEDYRLQKGKVTVIDREGREEGGFDFAIATDGSRSRLREASAMRCRVSEYSYAALWTTGPCDAEQEQLYQVIDGTRRLVGLLPIGGGQCSFFWGLRSDQYSSLMEAGLSSWKDEVVALCPEARQLTESIESLDSLTFSGYRHVGMKHWNDESMIFLGDAAHASSPHLGQGANLALEDAACFADALQQTDDFQSACQQFRQQRLRKLRYYQQLARLLTPFFQSDVPLLALGRDLTLPWFPRVPWMRRRMLRTLCGLHDGWWK